MCKATGTVKFGAVTVIDCNGDACESLGPLLSGLPMGSVQSFASWMFSRMQRRDNITVYMPSREELARFYREGGERRRGSLLLSATLNGLTGGVMLRYDGTAPAHERWSISSHT